MIVVADTSPLNYLILIDRIAFSAFLCVLRARCVCLLLLLSNQQHPG